MTTKRLPDVTPFGTGYIQVYQDKASAQADDILFDSWADVPPASVIGTGLIRVGGVLYDCDGVNFTAISDLNPLPITLAQVALQSGTIGQKRKLSDGSDKGVILVFSIPDGSSPPVWCWDLYPNAKYEV